MDMNEFLDMFIAESEEHILAMSDEMMRFEQNPKNIDIVASMFRAAHTLKGMAGTMGFEKTQKLTHTIENMMDDIRNEVIEPNGDTIDFMFKGIERLEVLLSEIKETGKEESSIDDLLNAEVKTEIIEKKKEDITFELSDLELETLEDAKRSGQNVYHVHFKLRDDCLLKVVRINMFLKHLVQLGEIIKIVPDEDDFENLDFDGIANLIIISNHPKTDIESLINKLSEVEKIEANDWDIAGSKEKKSAEPVATTTNLPATEKEEIEENKVASSENKDSGKEIRKQSASIRVNLDKIDALMGLFEELIVEKGMLQNISRRIQDNEFAESLDRLSRNSTEMQNVLLSMRMIPLETILNRFPRMIRTTSKELGKNIKFLIEGADTELDRTVVEELGDPLVHLLRNSLDHGIEMPEVRKERGKEEQGQILLKAFRRGNEAIIEIKDDGNGINVEKIKNKILKQNLLSKDELDLLTEEQIVQYIFSSGLSTADTVSNLSGRGVGLDVVKTKIESLGGTVKVETEAGVGSKFSIVLPLTLSIIQSLLVRESFNTFSIPLSNVVETILIQEGQVNELLGREVLYYRNEVYNIHRYSGISNYEPATENTYALIIENSFQKYALLVDEIIGQQEIVLKPLKGFLEKAEGTTGATVLGDGSISFVFDVNYFKN